MEVRKNIGKIVAQRRIALGLTQPQLAKLSGLTTQTINRIERGRPPREANLKAIAEALGSSLDDFDAPSMQWKEPTARELNRLLGIALAENDSLKKEVKVLKFEIDDLRIKYAEKVLEESKAKVLTYSPSRNKRK